MLEQNCTWCKRPFLRKVFNPKFKCEPCQVLSDRIDARKHERIMRGSYDESQGIHGIPKRKPGRKARAK